MIELQKIKSGMGEVQHDLRDFNIFSTAFHRARMARSQFQLRRYPQKVPS